MSVRGRARSGQTESPVRDVVCPKFIGQITKGSGMHRFLQGERGPQSQTDGQPEGRPAPPARPPGGLRICKAQLWYLGDKNTVKGLLRQ